MRGYDYVAQQLKALGVTHAFGLMSDDTLWLIAQLDSIGITYVSARHESNAVAMAEGYASAAGRLGVAIVGRGPALTNSMHGAAYAAKARGRVLVLVGDPPARAKINAWGPDEKEIDASGMLRAAGLEVLRATSGDGLPDLLAAAVRSASRGRPTALLLPFDVQREELAGEPRIGSEPASPPVARVPIREASLRAAVAEIARSRRPLIIAGAGACKAGARADIEALAERIGALVVTTAKAKGLFRGSPYDVGLIGSFSFSVARRAAEQADCVIAFGASLNKRSMSSGSAVPAGATVIQVDADSASLGRWLPCDIGIRADAREAARALLAALPARAASDKPFHSADWLGSIADFDPAREFLPANTARTMDPRSLAIALDKLLPARRVLVYDTGNFIGILPYLDAPGPDCIKLSADFASVGMGMGVAIGTCIARPGEVTVLFVGDGGFLMAMGEIETAARQGLPLVVVVMNDCAYGAEMHFLKMNDMPVSSAVFPDVEFAAVAQPFGFDAHAIRSIADLERVADVLRAPEGPVLLDCKINNAVQAPFLGEPREALSRRTP